MLLVTADVLFADMDAADINDAFLEAAAVSIATAAGVARDRVTVSAKAGSVVVSATVLYTQAENALAEVFTVAASTAASLMFEGQESFQSYGIQNEVCSETIIGMHYLCMCALII